MTAPAALTIAAAVLTRAGDLSAVTQHPERWGSVIGIARPDPEWPDWWAIWVVDVVRAYHGPRPPWTSLAGRALRQCTPGTVVRWVDPFDWYVGLPGEQFLVLRNGTLLVEVVGR